MKKFISFTAAVIMMMNLTPYTVVAEETKVTGLINEGNVSVQYGALENDWAVINGYTDGKLAMSCKSEKTDNVFIFDLPALDKDIQMRISYSGGEIYPFLLESAETVTSPAPTEPEKETAPPSATEPVGKKYPQAYEKPLDALHAPAVVNDSQVSVIDGETYYVLELLYLGEEITVNVRDTIVINSAPLRWQELEGQEPSMLKKGDVIHFLCDMLGRVKTIDLMYRPEFTDYVSENANLSLLYNHDGYSKYYFAVPIEAKKGYVLLAGTNGKTTEVNLNPSVMVYTVEEGGKKPLCEFTGMGYNAISKTVIPKSNLDDDGNVISWADVDDQTYALVRVVDDEATDVIVFVK